MKKHWMLALFALTLAFPGFSQQSQPVVQDGMGSWYDDQNTTGLFAAHATFPFGTLIRVTNLENNRQATVQIGGRIPRDTRWIIDMSFESAYALGMNQSGFTRVRIEEIPRENRPRVLQARQAGVRRFFQNGRAELWSDGQSLTAGHPSLPMGTRLRVTNRNNGQKIEVVIATRIRAAEARIVSLSRPAADQLGILFDRQGLGGADVTIESIE